MYGVKFNCVRISRARAYVRVSVVCFACVACVHACLRQEFEDDLSALNVGVRVCLCLHVSLEW